MDGDAPRVIPGFRVVAALPDGLGSITELCVKGGALVASTSSGVDYVVPDLGEGELAAAWGKVDELRFEVLGLRQQIAEMFAGMEAHERRCFSLERERDWLRDEIQKMRELVYER